MLTFKTLIYSKRFLISATNIIFAGIKLDRSYNLDAPQGVRGRNSENTMIKDVLGWAPSISLQVGLEKTYKWIYDQITIK